ncbi:MAG: MFS transporter [Elusimicrobia bacterium]|nr:MFS transporter [Elusimicrobiota bacterium]
MAAVDPPGAPSASAPRFVGARRDRYLIYVSAVLRAAAISMLSVFVGIYLTELRFSARDAGLVVSLGLAGSGLATAFVTFRADRLGRRRVLIALSLLAAAGGLAMALARSFAAVAAAAFVGMLNGMGKDRGGAVVLEQAILPATVPDEQRTKAYAWYHALENTGSAAGALMAGLPTLMVRFLSVSEAASYRLAIVLYAALIFLSAFCYAAMSHGVELYHPQEKEKAKVRIGPETRRIVLKLSSLFALDSLGGGFIVTALLSYYFFARFHVDLAFLALLFCAARAAQVLSNFAAAWLASKIGLVNTMVFTHIPSNLLLIAVVFAPNFPVAALLYLCRAVLSSMDVPTRQSYVMSLVKPEERTFASGATHLVRMSSWAVAPYIAGAMMEGVSLGSPLFAAAGLKIAYDLLLFASFRDVKPPEEA